MADISNKFLAVMLVGVMLFSLLGSLVALRTLKKDVELTGLVTSGTGLVNLSIEQVVSIYMQDSSIQFGLCSPVGGVVTNITSDGLQNTSLVCPSFTPDNLSVRNDGNVNVSVAMNTSKVGKQDNSTAPTANILLNSSSQKSSIMYKTTSSGRTPHTGGCTSLNTTSYSVLREPNRAYGICNNLVAHNTANSVAVDFLIQMPQDAPVGAESTTLNFAAVISATP